VDGDPVRMFRNVDIRTKLCGGIGEFRQSAFRNSIWDLCVVKQCDKKQVVSPELEVTR
jgi:hypothetical protein